MRERDDDDDDDDFDDDEDPWGLRLIEFHPPRLNE